MNKFFRLCIGEFLKIFTNKTPFFFVGVIFVLVTANGFLSNHMTSSSSHWKSQVKEEISDLEDTLKIEDIPAGVASSTSQNIDLLNYHLDNDINPYEVNAWTFINDSFMITSLITLFTVIIASKIVAREFTKGTIKFLIIRPFKRWKILLSKYVATLTFGFLLYLLFIVIATIVGTIFYGFGSLDFTVINNINGSFTKSYLALNVLGYFLSKLISTVVISSIAFTISTVCKSETLAVMISLAILFGGTIFTSFISHYWWSKYLLFNNLNLTEFVTNGEIFSSQMGISLLIIVSHFIVMIILSFTVFNKKDIGVV
jgi:ABC-2 type transport system permease protein